MSTLHSNVEPQERQSNPTTTAVLGRLTWMLVGPFVLVLSLMALWRKERGTVGAPDIVYFTALAAMLIGRWAEFHSGHGRTGAGEPVTLAHLRRYLSLTLGKTNVWS
jgi:hypothetical protein